MTTALDRMTDMLNRGEQKQQYQISASYDVHTDNEKIGHVLLCKELAPEYDRAYIPIPSAIANTRGMSIMGGHFLWVLGASLFISMGSLILGSAMGSPAGVGATLGIQMVAVGLYHGLATYAAYKVAQPYGLMVHINPLVSFFEMVHGSMGYMIGLTQLIAQGIGYSAGAAIVYGILNNGSLYTVGVSSVLDTARTSSGGMLAVELISGFFFGWLLWHNYTHRLRFYSDREQLGLYSEGKNLPAALGAVIAFTTAMAFPFGGISMHQPFRFLQGCVLAGGVGPATCGAYASWTYLSGGAIGLFGALLGHLLTQSLDGDSSKYRYNDLLAKASKSE